jgi:hypothetical protein
MTTPLGSLQQVPLRDIWISESGDFTPWLAGSENLKLLGQVLEMDLEFEAQEKYVGPFRADIFCREIGTGNAVLIENQLERTDHSHLGQLLTYAAGLSAVSIVWIAERFTDEHRAALDWLNERTPEEINFFGLEIELWRIGDSAVAPKFNIVCKPNEWTRRIIETRVNTELMQFCSDYWDGVFEKLRPEGILTQTAKPIRRKDTRFDVGWKNFHLKAYFSTAKKEMAVWMSCRGSRGFENFKKIMECRQQIEAAFNAELAWTPDEDKNRGTCLHPILGYDANNRQDWPRQHELIAKMVASLYRALDAHARPLDVNDEDTPNG